MRLIVVGIALFELSLVVGLFSQDKCVVRGRILDKESGEPISGVNVIVRSEKKGAMTDTAGYFRLDFASSERRTIVFSHVAYQKEVQTVAFDTTKEVRLRLRLARDTIQLKEYVVSAERIPTPSATAEKTALFNINGDEFERLGDKDMERALRYLLPQVVARPETRQMVDSLDFTLYINGEWKESVYLDQIDPFSIRRVKAWGYLGIMKDIDVFPIGFPLHRGRYVVIIDTK